MKCPNCGADLKKKPGSNRWYCSECGWTDTMGSPTKQEMQDKATMGSPPFSDNELKQGFRKGK